jgi:hypothetical protein
MYQLKEYHHGRWVTVVSTNDWEIADRLLNADRRLFYSRVR